MESKKFKDTRTGEIVTQFNIMDIKYMEEIKPENKVIKELNEGKEVKATDLMRSMGIEVIEG